MSPKKENKWQPFMGDCDLCAEILAGKNNYSPWIIVKFLDALLRGFGQVIFSNNPVSGFLFLLAFICVSPIKASVAIITGSLGVIWSVIIGHKPRDISAGLTTYNPILLGCFAHHAVPTIYSNFQIHIWIALIIGVFLCVYLATALSGFLSKWNVPCLTIPYILVEYLLILGIFNNYTNLQPNSENINPEITTEVFLKNVSNNNENLTPYQNNIIKEEPAPLMSPILVHLFKGDGNNMPFENTSSIKMITSSLLEKDEQYGGTTSEKTNQPHLVTTTTTTTINHINTTSTIIPATSIPYNEESNNSHHNSSSNSSSLVTVVATPTTDSIISTNLSTYLLPTPLSFSWNITNDTQIDNNERMMENNDSSVNFGQIFAATVHSAGALFAVESTFLSGVIYLCIIIYSPIMGVCSFFGAFFGVITALGLLNVPIEECYNGLWGYNSLLISAALCGMTWVVTAQTVLACIFCILFGVFTQYALNFVFAHTTLIQYNLAFNFGVMSFLCMTQVLGHSFPQPEVHSFPEKHRYDYVSAMKLQNNPEFINTRDEEFYVKRVSIVKLGTDDSHLISGS